MAYVKLEDVLNIIKEQNCNNTGIIQHIKQHCHTANVVEVKHGYLDYDPFYIEFTCSVCGSTQKQRGKYCINCGAKMDGGGN